MPCCGIAVGIGVDICVCCETKIAQLAQIVGHIQAADKGFSFKTLGQVARFGTTLWNSPATPAPPGFAHRTAAPPTPPPEPPLEIAYGLLQRFRIELAEGGGVIFVHPCIFQ
jgi:hypothetical protein